MGKHPVIIQGGMGVAVSNWTLAKAVSSYGQLGVVSGTFIDTVIARRLQDGDRDGSIRRALMKFPNSAIAGRVLQEYFIPGGKSEDQPYKPVAMHSLRSPQSLVDLTVVANFVEVFLAKEDHDGIVGINYLTKIDLPTLPSLYGAMLAGVDYVLMGAGIPKAIPAVIDDLLLHRPATLRIDVINAAAEETFETSFDPAVYGAIERVLKRPKFLPIVSSSTLAQSLLKKCGDKIDGFVVEHYTAGGHNAPPRGGIKVDEHGEPIYSLRDEPELERFAKLGVPFWLAGSYGDSKRLKDAMAAGAAGIQVGTAFAFSQESGITDDIKRRVIAAVLDGTVSVFTDPRASSSGYPFKLVQLTGTASDDEFYCSRRRICDLGYLRTAVKMPDGRVQFRCAAEPVEQFIAKGGTEEEAAGRKCLCNGLLSTVGLPQVRQDYVEPPMVTAGVDLKSIKQFLKPGAFSYSARDVLEALLAPEHSLVASA